MKESKSITRIGGRASGPPATTTPLLLEVEQEEEEEEEEEELELGDAAEIPPPPPPEVLEFGDKRAGVPKRGLLLAGGIGISIFGL